LPVDRVVTPIVRNSEALAFALSEGTGQNDYGRGYPKLTLH